jgi:hypothetical protein
MGTEEWVVIMFVLVMVLIMVGAWILSRWLYGKGE